jgi:hypothetical protein
MRAWCVRIESGAIPYHYGYLSRGVLDILSVSVPACARRCGHVSEETKNADRMCPWGIMMAVGSSVVLGFGYILALLFSVQVHHPAISHQ